jgi:D-alanyl-D-alanine carboxypeptidase
MTRSEMPPAASRPRWGRRALAGAVVVPVLVLGAACGSTTPDTAGTTSSVAPGTTPGTSSTPADGSLAVVEDGLDAATTEALNAAASTAFEDTSAPGAVVAVRTPEGTWVATVGFQDWERTVPMTADVNQRIGSVTKTFTVTALLQLAEEGALSLDDRIEQYVPGMPNGTATLAQLAEMRSGIPSYTFDKGFQTTLFSDPDYVWEPQQLVDLVKGQPAMFEPGTMTFYSNTNLILLGMVIEQVTGKPIDDVMQERIIGPLGLDHTLMPTDGSYPEPHPQGYTMQGVDGDSPNDATDWNPSWGWTAGAMISNLDDLLVWGEALATGEGILTPETQAERLDSFDFDVPVYAGPGKTAPQTPARAYGLGLGLALDWYGHEGELPGFNTYVQHYEPEGITLVVMVNADILSGSDCTEDQPTVPSNPGVGPCQSPASRIAEAVAEALGYPLAEPRTGDATTTTTTSR